MIRPVNRGNQKDSWRARLCRGGHKIFGGWHDNFRGQPFAAFTSSLKRGESSMTKMLRVVVRPSGRTIVLLAVLIAAGLTAAAQAAPLVFNEAAYRQLTDAGSPNTIAPG